MISKNKIKFLRSLGIKKYRDKNNKSILEGVRLINESINHNAQIDGIWICETYKNLNNQIISKNNSKELIDYIKEEDFKLLSNTKHSQGIIAEVNTHQNDLFKFSKPLNENIIIIDSISDPGNLGTIFRTCAWFGIKTVILSTNTTDAFNPKCLRSGMGSHFYFNNILKGDNNNIIDLLSNSNFNVLCADLEGDNIGNLNIEDKPWALILGSEANGISDDFSRYNKITIPKKGSLESLNVSVACGIILHQLFK